MDWIFESWEWYIAGPILGLFVPALLLIGNKQFGLSQSFDQICYSILPGGKNFLKELANGSAKWKVFFMVGIAFGAYLSQNFLSETPTAFLPEDYYTLIGLAQLFGGGILIGFGTRYANGCTSGHAIFGLATLNVGSLIATICFFIGGLLLVNLSKLI